MDNSVCGKPLLITHWDPDVYPTRPSPGIQELVVYGLLMAVLRPGARVLIKDVDLLLNPSVRAAFEDDAVLGQFESLLHTDLFKVLLPPESTDFGGLDPSIQPLTAVAHERDLKKRPFKSRVRKLTRSDAAYCAKLDRILVSTSAIQFRKDFPATNTFAPTLISVLSGKHLGWRGRPQFRGITSEIAQEFLPYCENPLKSIERLSSDGVAPNARQVYRSLLYQVADRKEFGLRHNSMSGARALKNLLQSVYAYCELDREGASGTYVGPRIAELPLTQDAHDGFLNIEMAPPLDLMANIPIAQNIGDILNEVLAEIPAQLDKKPAANTTLEDTFAHIASAFAKHSVTTKPVRWSSTVSHRWRVFKHRIGFGSILADVAMHAVGKMFISSFEFREGTSWALETIDVLTYCSEPLVQLIRTGKAYDERETQRARVARALLGELNNRVSHVERLPK